MNRWSVLGAGLLVVLGASLSIRGLACRPAPNVTREGPQQQVHAERIEPKQPARAARSLEPAHKAPRVPEPPPQNSGDPAPKPQAPPIPESGHFQALQRAFDSEPRDDRWAREQEARVPRLIAEAGFPDDAFDRNVSCRRTLCRFSLRVVDQSEADMLALMKLAAAVQTRDGLSLAYAAEVDGDDVRLVVLTPSEGTSLADAAVR